MSSFDGVSSFESAGPITRVYKGIRFRRGGSGRDPVFGGKSQFLPSISKRDRVPDL